MDIKNINKVWVNSLSFLDNSIVKSVIIIILVLYSSSIFDNINSFVGNIYNFSIVRLLILLVIVYVSPKCPTIGILLGISYVISLSYMVNNENFAPFQDNKFNYSPVSPTSVQEENQNNYKRNVMVDRSVPAIEPFFPLVNEDDTSKSFDMRLRNTNVNTRSNSNQEHRPSGNVNVPESCMQNYTPQFETVSDVCTPTATFKNELNAQGLNFPEGFNHTVNGSPL
jgi:hypothetical protein